MNERYVGGKMFENIKIDSRVTPELQSCLYCSVTSHERSDDGVKHGIENTNYEIKLDCIQGNSVKQCPACKRIYLLKDPTQ